MYAFRRKLMKLLEKCAAMRRYEDVRWCPGAESNHRHCDFQSHALPTELPGRLPASRRSGSRLIGGLAAPCPGRAPSNFGRGGEPSEGAPIAPRGLQYSAVETAMHRAATCD